MSKLTLLLYQVIFEANQVSYSKIKGKVSPITKHKARKVYIICEGKAPHIIQSATCSSCFTSGVKATQYQLDRKLAGPQI